MWKCARITKLVVLVILFLRGCEMQACTHVGPPLSLGWFWGLSARLGDFLYASADATSGLPKQIWRTYASLWFFFFFLQKQLIDILWNYWYHERPYANIFLGQRESERERVRGRKVDLVYTLLLSIFCLIRLWLSRRAWFLSKWGAGERGGQVIKTHRVFVFCQSGKDSEIHIWKNSSHFIVTRIGKIIE